MCTGISGIQNDLLRCNSTQSNTRVFYRSNISTTKNDLLRHNSMILKQDNSTYSIKNNKKLSNLSVKLFSSQKKHSKSFLNNTKPLNDSIVLFNANNRTKIVSSSFLNSKTTIFYLISNQMFKKDEYKSINKKNNELFFVNNKIKTSNTINQNLNVQSEIKSSIDNLKTDIVNFPQLTNFNSSNNKITKNYNNLNLINNNLKNKNINKSVSKIISSDIVIANTFALLKILENVERKSYKNYNDFKMPSLIKINNKCNEIKTLSKITQKIIKQNLSNSSTKTQI